jgi:hypothetical protein
MAHIGAGEQDGAVDSVPLVDADSPGGATALPGDFFVARGFPLRGIKNVVLWKPRVLLP